MVHSTRLRTPVQLVALILVTGFALVAGRQMVTEESPKGTDWRKLGYKTTKPTIGILAQSCHDCPGRYVEPAFFFFEIPARSVHSITVFGLLPSSSYYSKYSKIYQICQL